jgi:hypothetical protein
MSMNIVSSVQVSGGGVSIAGAAQRACGAAIPIDEDVAAGAAGTLSTRTGDHEGQVTAVGHGVSTGNIFDLFWAGGRAYNVTAGTVNGNVVPFATSPGDVLPSASTAVVICKRTNIDAVAAYANIQLLAALLDTAGLLTFLEDDGTVIAVVDLIANEPWTWLLGQSTIPLAADVAQIGVSTNGVAAAVIKALIGYDPTP